MITIELDDEDIAIIRGGLAATYGGARDAITARAGAPYGYSRSRSEPVEIDSCIDTLDRVERMAQALQVKLPGYCTRERALAYYQEQADIWFAEQALSSGNRIGDTL